MLEAVPPGADISMPDPSGNGLGDPLASGCYDIAVDVTGALQDQSMASVRADLELLSLVLPPNYPYPPTVSEVGSFVHALYTIRRAKGTALSVALQAIARTTEGWLPDPQGGGIVKRVVEKINQFYRCDAERMLKYAALVGYPGKVSEIEADMNKINKLTEDLVNAITTWEQALDNPIPLTLIQSYINRLSDTIGKGYHSINTWFPNVDW